MKNFRAADKSHAGGDEKHDINFHWPYDTIFSNKISRRVFTPLLNKSHRFYPHKITFRTGGQVPSEHYTNRNNHIFTSPLGQRF